MMPKAVMGGAAIAVGGLIALNETLAWNGSLNYLLAVFVVIWGVMVLISDT